MLELTVKTLDSQNHCFTLPDEATVLNLKESIFEKMEVPVTTQRLIFHGKVLQDQKKLTEYGDVNGKVIHLVQRAPPSARASEGTAGRSEPNAASREGRRLQRGNYTYLGSMAFPAEFVDAQGLEISTRPSQAMARNRIDCANRMMNYARQSIRHMEDPGSLPQPQVVTFSDAGPTETAPQDAVTLTVADERGTSRASLSRTGDRQDIIDQQAATATAGAIAAAVSAAQQVVSAAQRGGLAPSITILRGSNDLNPDRISSNAEESNISFHDPNQDVAVEVEIESSDAEMEGRPDVGQNVQDNSTEGPPLINRREEGTRVESMVPLLQYLEDLHGQLQPFLVRCREVLFSDNSFEDNTSASYQESVRVFNGVSETLHSLAHACHALSDLMVDFDEDPPRSLRCRPVVLQHSTILETGFPIRFNPQDFEAQINVRRVDADGSIEITETSVPHSTSTPVTRVSNTTSTPSSDNSSPSTGRSGGTGSGSGVYVAAGITPVPGQLDHQGRLRLGSDDMAGDLEFLMDFSGDAMLANLESQGVLPPRTRASSSGVSSSSASATTGTPTSLNTATPSPVPPPATPPVTIAPTLSTAGPFNVSFAPAPDMRAYVALPANASFNLLQSVQAIAGQIHSQIVTRQQRQQIAANARAARATNNQSPSQPAPPSSSTTAETPAPVSDAAGPPAARPPPQGAEAPPVPPRLPPAPPFPPTPPGMQGTPQRRAIPVPVGDMFHTLFQGTFDPTLPCNSHHIRTTRQRASQTPRARVEEARGNALPPLQILTQRLGGLGAVPAVVARVRRYQQTAQPDGPLSSEQPAPALRMLGASIPRLLSRLIPASDGAVPLSGTIADFLNSVTDAPHVEGQSIVSDLLMTLARNLTWIDVVDLSVSQGSVMDEILARLRPVLQEFASRRLLQGDNPSEEAINRACGRLFSEMRPFIDVMQLARLRESVDISATINNYNQSQLPEMISLIVDPDVGTTFGSRLSRRLSNYIRQLVAIVMHCCIDGDRGFDLIVRNCVRLLTRGVPEDLQQWTEFHSVTNLRYYIARLHVPLDEIQQYLVYRIPNTPVPDATSTPQELMETDSPAGDPGWVSPVSIPSPEKPEEPIAEALVAMDTENLPEVVIGSESWHSTLPPEWVPVIARDTQRQRKQSSQKPFSDAYLSGMPPKRRKIIGASKPQGDSVSQNISEGLRQAIHSAGVSAPGAERAIADAGRDPVLQQAYKQQEKAVGSQVLRSDPEFKSSRFPNAHKYFEK